MKRLFGCPGDFKDVGRFRFAAICLEKTTVIGSNMKIKTASSFVLTLIVGICAGWFGNAYWESKVRKAKSTMAAVSAHEAAQSGDLDKAIEYATMHYCWIGNRPLQTFS